MSSIDGNTTARNLIPGPGGKYISEAFTAAATGAETIYIAQCTGISVQQTLVGSPAGTFQLEETLNGTNWDPFGPPVSVDAGQITKYEESLRPNLRIRINGAGITGLSSTVTFQLQIQGHAVGSGLT